MSTPAIQFPDPQEATRDDVTQSVIKWRELRAKRLEVEKEAEKIKQQELAHKNFVIASMLAQRYEGIVEGGRVTGVNTKEVPTCADRAAFDKFVLETGSLDLLQFRLSTGAINDRFEKGIEVPGIEFIDTYDLYDRKA